MERQADAIREALRKRTVLRKLAKKALRRKKELHLRRQRRQSAA